MNYLLTVSLCLALFYGGYLLLYRGKNNHIFNRIYLLGGLVLSLLLPAWQIPIFPEYVTFAPLPEGVNPTVVIPAKTELFTWQNVLLIIWLSGVLLRLSLTFIRFFRLQMLIENGEKIPTADYTKIITEGNVPVSSFLYYMFIPRAEYATISPYKIKHEETHIKQKHSYDILFLELYRAVFWFNPILIFYERSLRAVHEFLADAGTLKFFPQDGYTDFLLQQAGGRASAKLIHNFSSLFKTRIDMIYENAKTKTWRYALLPAVILTAFTLFSFTTYPVPTQDLSDTAVLIDSIPEQVDTVIVYDPETKTETVHIVRKKTTGEPNTFTWESADENQIDTITVFDPETFKETIYIVNHKTGVTDTIRQE